MRNGGFSAASSNKYALLVLTTLFGKDASSYDLLAAAMCPKSIHSIRTDQKMKTLQFWFTFMASEQHEAQLLTGYFALSLKCLQDWCRTVVHTHRNIEISLVFMNAKQLCDNVGRWRQLLQKFPTSLSGFPYGRRIQKVHCVFNIICGNAVVLWLICLRHHAPPSFS